MKTGIYRLVICEKISPNGLPVNHIEFVPIDKIELDGIKETAKLEGWKIYCQGELSQTELRKLQ